MSKLYQLSFVKFTDAANHMLGVNFGDHLDAQKRNAKIYYEPSLDKIHVYFQGGWSTIPTSAAKSWDYIEVPEHLLQIAQVKPVPIRASVNVPEPVQIKEYAPEDQSPEAHRARVRAASANSNKAQPVAHGNNDLLIQQARNEAMGLKSNKVQAQVQNAQQVGQQASVTGKKKAISHAELKAQVDSEMKS